MRSGRVLGILLILAGGVFLANTMGLLTWNIWQSILALWPILLVGLGLRIATGKPLFVHIALIVIIVWSVVAPVTYFPFIPNIINAPKSEANFLAQKDDIEEASVSLHFGAGNVTLRGGSAELLDARVSYAGERPVLKQEITSGKADLTLEHTRGGGDWTIRLNSDVLLDLVVKAGASKLDLDLKTLEVSSLLVEAGASDVSVTFGDKVDEVNTRIKAGASSITLLAPSTTGLRVRLDGGLSSHNLNDLNLERRGDYWYTPGFDGAQKQLTVDVDLGVGSLNLRRY